MLQTLAAIATISEIRIAQTKVKSISVPVQPDVTTRRGARRRDVLAFLGAAAGLPVASRAAFAQTPLQAAIQGVPGEGQRFDPAAVVEAARALSRRPFAAPANDLPDVFAGLNYEQYIAIKPLPEARIWADEGRGFMAEPLHRGFVFSSPVSLFSVEDGAVRRIAYDRSRFDFGKLNTPANLPDIGFSGFRLYSTFGDGVPVEFALVQGATFFRALARGQNFGLVARGLTLRPAETKGEEFPAFRAFWLERPGPGANALVVHGLMDSETVAGAVRMTFRPGEMTIVDVETTLFPRVNLEHVGLGGMGGTYFFGPNDRRNVDDARPAVHEVSGLQVLNGQGEWLWRPVHNPETLQISAFLDNNPRGFGLLQRERDYNAFQDDDQRFERRPSLWIEPIGEWGPGAVQLIEIPTDSEIHDNILAYWRPRAAMAAGSEVSLAYRQFWCWAPPERPPLATVARTRVGRGANGRRRRFFVDFAGDVLGNGPIADFKPILTTSPGTIHAVRVLPYPDRRTMRVSFELDPGNDNACELRLLLEAGAKPISETWLYRWTP
jgi:glucans biosynthesis protein